MGNPLHASCANPISNRPAALMFFSPSATKITVAATKTFY